jgi:hypothetical protein
MARYKLMKSFMFGGKIYTPQMQISQIPADVLKAIKERGGLKELEGKGVKPRAKAVATPDKDTESSKA